MTLTERLHARECRTEGCSRAAIRDGAYCSDCTNTVWSTGKAPIVARWVEVSRQREHGLARDMSVR